ncbi:MAG: hypothetical protein IJY08_03465 [Clostridia bacterium]|nr:hypothetical protein [Clostridia bacterium]
MKEYISPECTLICTQTEDIMVTSGGTLSLDDSNGTSTGYGVYQWPF